MKRLLMGLLFKKWNSGKSAKKTIKTFILVGLLGLFLTGALVFWAGVTTLNLVVSTGNNLVQSAKLQTQAENLTLETGGRRLMRCWGSAQSLFEISSWMQVSPREKLATLKAACLDGRSAPCKGLECEVKRPTPDNFENGHI